MHSAFVNKPSIVAQQQLLSQSGRHCHFEIAAAISPHGSRTQGRAGPNFRSNHTLVFEPYLVRSVRNLFWAQQKTVRSVLSNLSTVLGARTLYMFFIYYYSD